MSARDRQPRLPWPCTARTAASHSPQVVVLDAGRRPCVAHSSPFIEISAQDHGDRAGRRGWH